MKKNLRTFLIPLIVIAFISVSCGSLSTPAPTQTALPTYTAQPSYTPLPTYTPFPTQAPTSTARVVLPTAPSIDYTEIDCPDISTYNLPGLTPKCYALNISPAAVGILLYSGGRLVVINITWDNSAPQSVINKVASFVVMEALAGNWNLDDLEVLTDRLVDTPQGETIRQGTLQAQWSKNTDYTSITYGLISFFEK